MTLEALFGIEIPILQAPMAGASPFELIAAVSNAGGLGGLGAAPILPETLRNHIHKIKARTDKPFNVNLFAPASEKFDQSATLAPEVEALLNQYNQELGIEKIPHLRGLFGPAETQLDVLIEERVPVISFHFGIEYHHVEKIHHAGLKVICSATTVEEAVTLEQLGVDAVIAQGAEAGGHRGTFIGNYQAALIGTMALVPQIVDAIDLPVIAAGGIMDARGIIAAEALGASGVQMGTAFLGCPETAIAPLWMDQLQNASADKTTVTRVFSGKPARGIRNRYVDDMEAHDDKLLPYSLQYAASGAIRAKAMAEGNPDFPSMWSGQGVGMLEQLPAAELIQKLVSETETLRSNLVANRVS